MPPKCRHCGQRYKPTAGHCTGGPYEGCCRSWATSSDFDRHRVGPFDRRRCLTDTELHAAGWTQREGGYWISPESVANSAQLRAHHDRAHVNRAQNNAAGQDVPE